MDRFRIVGMEPAWTVRFSVWNLGPNARLIRDLLDGEMSLFATELADDTLWLGPIGAAEYDLPSEIATEGHPHRWDTEVRSRGHDEAFRMGSGSWSRDPSTFLRHRCFTGFWMMDHPSGRGQGGPRFPSLCARSRF
jgi:hypothetical protein